MQNEMHVSQDNLSFDILWLLKLYLLQKSQRDIFTAVPYER